MIEADYGGVSVTAHLRMRTLNGELQTRALPESIGIPDPAFMVPKHLNIKYTVDGRECFVSYADGDYVHLPST